MYRILTDDFGDPFQRRFAWHLGVDVDAGAMQAAGESLEGEHDFAAFCKVHAAGGTVRRLDSLRVDATKEGRVDVWAEASSFCHQMVRSIVGLLSDIGRDRRPVDDALAVLVSGDRRRNSNVAPPHGLTLWDVQY